MSFDTIIIRHTLINTIGYLTFGVNLAVRARQMGDGSGALVGPLHGLVSVTNYLSDVVSHHLFDRESRTFVLAKQRGRSFPR